MTALSGYVIRPLRQRREHVLYRGRRADGDVPVLVLVPRAHTHSSVARLEHEYALRAELPDGCCARPLALVRDGPQTALVLEDPGGEPLDGVLDRPLEMARFLRLAISCSEALAQIHARGLVHGDINPANLLVDGDEKVALTGFGLAFRPTPEYSEGAATDAIAGRFAYMAPEQTGRTSHRVDFRSDLYSLGVTFYEMLVGAPPFTASDPVEWIHSHIARRPVPPAERRSGIPGPVDAIVVKLLSKVPGERYQTAAGLAADLGLCLPAWVAHARIDPFALGTRDFDGRLQIPDKLYGREAKTAALVAAFDRVAKHGDCEVVFVTGYAGAGKSSLVNELRNALPTPRRIFGAGKFEQHASDIPYAPVAQACQNLVRQTLAASDAELSRWRPALLEALASNGQLMVDLVPELSLIIGEQPQMQDDRSQDTQNRFRLVFRRFLGVFARPERPLVLFFDDLQWVDAATLALL